MENDTNFYGNFLVKFLNLEFTTPNICKLLKHCNKIIPIKNINDCIDLLLSCEETKPEQIWKKLPTKLKRQIGKFYREPKNKSTIYLYWEIGVHGGHWNEITSNIPFTNGTTRDLQSEINNIRDHLIALIKSMISVERISDAYKESYFILLADNYPGDKIYIDNDSIVLKPNYSPYWGFRHDYIEKCISYAFFKYFMIDKNFKRIKFCSVCSQAFVAKDMKRKRCYLSKCDKEFQRIKKQRQRGNDPVKYY